MLAKKVFIEQPDEKALLKEMASGNYAAFTLLYKAHVRQVTNYAFKFTDDIQIIEDSIHDIFVWLWNNRCQLQINNSFKGYLLKSVRTSVISKIQKNKKVILSDKAGEENNFCSFMSPEAESSHADSYCILQKKMADALGTLTAKQKEVVYLRFYQGLSFDEIAANMNLTTKGCYKLMGRAISELRKNFHSFEVFLSFFILLLNFF